MLSKQTDSVGDTQHKLMIVIKSVPSHGKHHKLTLSTLKAIGSQS
jgi:hypothetical protein